MKIINIILIDDNILLREGITEIIDQQPDMKMLATFGESNKALTKISDMKPDVLLLDLGLPNHNSLIFMRSLMRKCPDIKVIVMDIVPIQKDILQYVEEGVSGFILKYATSDHLLNTIRSVANDEKVLPANLTESLFSQIVNSEVNQLKTSNLIQKVFLTKQEREIVLLIAEGLTNKEIVQKLNLSANTVKNHIHNILEKMVLNTQIQFAIYAPPSEDINITDSRNHPKIK